MQVLPGYPLADLKRDTKMSRLKLMSVYCALWARQHRSTWGRGSSTCPHVTAPEAPGSALASGHALSPGHHSAPTSAPGPTWLACSGLPNTHAPSRAHRRARPTASPDPCHPLPPAREAAPCPTRRRSSAKKRPSRRRASRNASCSCWRTRLARSASSPSPRATARGSISTTGDA